MRCPLWLDGWDDRSVWGWDDQSGSLFAQLYANDAPVNENDDPHVHISPLTGWPVMTKPVYLAMAIAEATGAAGHDVWKALDLQQARKENDCPAFIRAA